MKPIDKETIEATDYYYQERIEERDRILKTLATQDKNHPMCKEVNNQINRIAQLCCATNAMKEGIELSEEGMKEIRKQLAMTMLGLKQDVNDLDE